MEKMRPLVQARMDNLTLSCKRKVIKFAGCLTERLRNTVARDNVHRCCVEEGVYLTQDCILPNLSWPSHLHLHHGLVRFTPLEDYCPLLT